MPTKKAAGAKGASTKKAAGAKRTCFVVMGFGKKTDYPTKRVLDLDKSYHNMIKPAVEAAGLTCIRADEITHSGSIDEKMYQQLLEADVVVADLSTSNANAFYELGVRHALRPYTTIIVADSKLTYPFDINHIAIRSYEHLGSDIGYSEVVRFQKELKEAIKKILSKQPEPDSDSPVYQFIRGLGRPQVAAEAAAGAGAKAAAPADAGKGPTVGAHMQRANELIDNAKSAADFLKAKFELEEARKMFKEAAEAASPPEGVEVSPEAVRQEDPYIIQRLALATYKSKYPTVIDALKEAHDLLQTLNPKAANDPETLGLWGAVHKRLWEEAGKEPGGGADAEERKKMYLDEAVQAYERGFVLLDDYYNGINLAFLLNARAASAGDPAEAVADFVVARRVRGEVLSICEKALAAIPAPDPALGKEVADKYRDQQYWVLATMAEAHVGMGREQEAQAKLAEAYKLYEGWRRETTESQIAKLRDLLADSPLRHVRAAGE
jgi:tetratricopeptide (TPR) repeat protein